MTARGGDLCISAGGSRRELVLNDHLSMCIISHVYTWFTVCHSVRLQLTFCALRAGRRLQVGSCQLSSWSVCLVGLLLDRSWLLQQWAADPCKAFSTRC